jgi:hypothetical protein
MSAGEAGRMFETDFPHPACMYPTRCTRWRTGRRPEPDVQRKILRGNAERVFDFTPAEPPVVASAH